MLFVYPPGATCEAICHLRPIWRLVLCKGSWYGVIHEALQSGNKRESGMYVHPHKSEWPCHIVPFVLRTGPLLEDIC